MTVIHPRLQLNELIHQPVRFSIMAALSGVKEVEFKFLRDAVQVSDSLLSRYVTQLEQAGYVHVRKGYIGKRPRTWLSITSAGHGVFASHVKALQSIAAGSDPIVTAK
jgi:DNA-binding MarR family transcriptional regulator